MWKRYFPSDTALQFRISGLYVECAAASLAALSIVSLPLESTTLTADARPSDATVTKTLAWLCGCAFMTAAGMSGGSGFETFASDQQFGGNFALLAATALPGEARPLGVWSTKPRIANNIAADVATK